MTGFLPELKALIVEKDPLATGVPKLGRELLWLADLLVTDRADLAEPAADDDGLVSFQLRRMERTRDGAW